MKLEISNSYSKITGLTKDLEKLVRSELSYTVGSYFGGRFSLPKKKSLISKRGEFPSGLVDQLEYLIRGNAYERIDLRQRPTPSYGMFNLSLPYDPYAEQREAAEVLCRRNGIASMPTGSGKSITMALLINKLQVKTLVVVPNLELKQQLTSSFKSYFGTLANITIENIDSSRLDSMIDFDALIIDECHHGAADTYRKLNKTAWKGIYHRACFTATPFRSKDDEQILLESLCGQIVYTLGYKSAVDRGYIVPVEAYYVDVPAQKPKGNQNSWASMYSELVVNNPHRNNLAIRLIRALEGIPTLTLVKEVTHGENIAIETNRPFAHGMADNTRQLILEFCLGEINSLIGTTGVIGEGIDTKPAEYVLLLGGGKSKTQFMQQVGRVVRRYKGKESGKVILFKDCSHKWMLQHYKEQVKILKEEYGIKPIRLDI